MVILPTRTDNTKVYGPPQGNWTHADWKTLPNGHLFEIISGILYENGDISDKDYSISRRLWELVGAPVVKQKIGMAFGPPYAYSLLPTGDIVMPEFGVQVGLTDESPKEIGSSLRPSVQPPALIFEIVTPKTSPYVTEIKCTAYAKAGVPEYAIIDPAERSLKLYRLKAVGEYGAPQEVSGTQSVSFQCLPRIEFHVNQLFDGAPDTTL